MTMGNEGMVRISTHTRTLAIGGGFVDYSLLFSFDRMTGGDLERTLSSA
jgi:hypothetical protein